MDHIEPAGSPHAEILRPEWLNIPAELRSRKQWAVSTLAIKPNGKKDKAPRSPRTGFPVDKTKLDELFTFDECATSGYPAIGYCVAASDPFAIIDLDPLDKDGKLRSPEVLEIMKELRDLHSDGYIEKSQSGEGWHIICAAKEPYGRLGVRREGIECYSQESYIICTGDVAKLGGPKPTCGIEGFEKLYATICSRNAGDIVTGALEGLAGEHLTPDQVVQIMRTAPQWRESGYAPGSDGSVVDQGLMLTIARYEPALDVLLTAWELTPFWRPEKRDGNVKKYREYLERSYRKALPEARENLEAERHGAAIANAIMSNHFAKENATMVAAKAAVDAAASAYEEVDAQKQVEWRDPGIGPIVVGGKVREGWVRPPQLTPNCIPPGRFGLAVSEVYRTSYIPMLQSALAAVLLFTAGTIGGRFRISGKALQIGIVVVAETGAGKNGVSDGIAKMESEAVDDVGRPFLEEKFFRGPGIWNSGQGLIQYFKNRTDRRNMYSVLGEFGDTFKTLTDGNAPPYMRETRRVIKDLFSNNTIEPSAIADKDKQHGTLSIAYSFCGDTTPGVFYGALDAGQIDDGLLPRMFIFEHHDLNPENEWSHGDPFHPELRKWLGDLITEGRFTGMPSAVFMTAEAAELIRIFGFDCRDRLKDPNHQHRALWNRAKEKALRLAANVAVFNWATATKAERSPNPVISEEEMQWAIAWVSWITGRFEKRFDTGVAGNDREAAAEEAISRIARAYKKMTVAERRSKYKVSEWIIETDYMTYDYLWRRLRMLKPWSEDVSGRKISGVEKKRLFDQDMAMAVEAELLYELSPQQCKTITGYSKGRVFAFGAKLFNK